MIFTLIGLFCTFTGAVVQMTDRSFALACFFYAMGIVLTTLALFI